MEDIKKLRSDIEIRSTAVIMGSVLEKIRIIYEHDKEFAGKLAIAYLEQVLMGDNSFSDDWLVMSQLTELARSAEISSNKYESKVKRTVDKQKGKAEELAAFIAEGKSQAEIAKIWGVSTSRVSQIKREAVSNFPELFVKEGGDMIDDQCLVEREIKTKHDDTPDQPSPQFSF